MSDILIVSGNFDEDGGTSNLFFKRLFKSLKNIKFVNGGTEEVFDGVINDINDKKYKTVLWLSSKEQTIKTINPDITLITLNNLEGDLCIYCKEPVIQVMQGDVLVLETESINTFNTEIIKIIDAFNSGTVLSPFEIEKPIKETKSEKNKDEKDDILPIVERLHLRVSKTSIDILYRPTHSYLEFINNDAEGLKEVKKLCSMTREEFEQYLKTKKNKISKGEVKKAMSSSGEDWFNNAWKCSGEKFMKEHKLLNPKEEPILF